MYFARYIMDLVIDNNKNLSIITTLVKEAAHEEK